MLISKREAALPNKNSFKEVLFELCYGILKNNLISLTYYRSFIICEILIFLSFVLM